MQEARVLDDVYFLSEAEKHQILHVFNDTQADYPSDLTTQEVFERQVEKTPDNLALVFEEQNLTYRQLNAKANQLARVLRAHGVKPDMPVGILIDRSPEMIIGKLAILKAGGAYLPIDPKYPAERIHFMLEDTTSPVLLTDMEMVEKIGYKGNFIDLHDEAVYSGDDSNLEVLNKPSDLAYIIYTSGSTGKPKGVMIEHRSLVNFAFWFREYHQIKESDRISQLVSYAFDAAVLEIYATLLSGASLYIIPDNIRHSLDNLHTYFDEHGITISFHPTPFGEYFLKKFENSSLRYLHVGGDKLRTFRSTNYQLINGYGPTECTVYTTTFPVTQNYDNIPIGKPLANMRIYILGKNNEIVPIGRAGELCVSGVGVGRGYWNRPNLTAEKFVENPYEPGERMYRTGDLARWLPDGNIEFLGRVDNLVKIRGFRMELQDIEIQLLKHDAITNAVVVVREDKHSTKELWAYCVMARDLTVAELREFLRKYLPEYMIPAHFVRLEEIPLTPNGKLDRKALREDGSVIEMKEAHRSPRNMKEEKIAKYWRRVLELEMVGIDDPFFEIGGHSLKAAILAAELAKEFEVSLNDVYRYQTISEMAEHIEERTGFLETKLNRLKEIAQTHQEAGIHPATTEVLANYRRFIDNYHNVNLQDTWDYRNVLLTGVTGYLGVYLLVELLKNTNVYVYCLIRGKNDADALFRLLNQLEYYFPDENIYDRYRNRIHFINGNLVEKYFGLSKQRYAELSVHIGCLIHSAANVKHYGHYEDFYKVNVVGTQRLIEFARTGRRKDFNHVSTVWTSEGHGEGYPFTEEEPDLAKEIDNYYADTKREAEILVTAARRKGIFTNIFRVGNCVFHSKTGHLQKNIEENAFFTVTKAFAHMGVVLDEDMPDFSFVDHVAKAIVLLFNRCDLTNENFHILNPKQIRLSEALNMEGLGLDIEARNFPGFIDFIVENFDNEKHKLPIEILMLHKGWLNEEFGKSKLYNVNLFSEKTQMLLKKLGFEWPELTVDNLRPMIERAMSCGFSK